ncbi:hypothetical protein ES703_02013 [subsurface metagenome]|nr:hypothetical protein [Dehalococcoidia bacterium]
MATEKLQEYIDSVEQLQQAYAQVRRLKEAIDEPYRYLVTQPYKMTVSNVNVQFVVTGDREYTLNGDNWPTAKQIAEVLSDYISKRDKAKTLYQSLSGAQKGTVKPPPDI